MFNNKRAQTFKKLVTTNTKAAISNHTCMSHVLAAAAVPWMKILAVTQSSPLVSTKTEKKMILGQVFNFKKLVKNEIYK